MSLSVAVLGASGYTGAELLRFLLVHPAVKIVALTAEKNAGQPVAAVLPHLEGRFLPDLCRVEQVDFSKTDLVYCALPHGATQDIVARLPGHVRVIDLSADFRLNDLQVYEKWYGQTHRAPSLQAEAVYGLTEMNREAISQARLIANPGCYPTAALLPLMPLMKADVIERDGIVIDAKSGASGAGRELKQGNLFCEVAEGAQAYAVAAHRHAPEIDQGLSLAAGANVNVTFTPHLVPMNRGIFESLYVRLAKGISAADIRRIWQEAYSNEPFIMLLPEGVLPSTRQVRGTNLCQISVVADRVTGRAILLSAIDNLVKGAAGQAVQNMNVMFGFEETTGLIATAMFP